ncbi:MAG TPA: class I SAM-dependent methyltransferase [Candidatus Acidoferrales bacterium]|nr:class I SAM-dependent methyltransferase [Candidatus Acidoferrales bacterium]
MNWTAKTRPGAAGTAAGAAPAKPGPATSVSPSANVRISNGLKEFLWLISDTPHGRVLDLGPAWQSTITFFIEKGYRVSTEDLLRAWKDFLTSEEESLRKAPVGAETDKVSASMLADKFLESALQYPEQSFHGVLAWDLLDYFDPEVVPRLMERLSLLLHPGGALLALFHSRPTERFHRYRVVDSQSIELLPSPTIAVHAHVFQNREILSLFGEFRSSKTFVGRDQVREALFLK